MMYLMQFRALRNSVRVVPGAAPRARAVAAGPRRRRRVARSAVPTSGYDVVIEAGGSETALQRAVDLAKVGSTVVHLGLYDPETVWPMDAAFSKEVALRPSLRYCSRYRRRDFAEAAATTQAAGATSSIDDGPNLRRRGTRASDHPPQPAPLIKREGGRVL
jgi:hypothetical protein